MIDLAWASVFVCQPPVTSSLWRRFENRKRKIITVAHFAANMI